MYKRIVSPIGIIVFAVINIVGCSAWAGTGLNIQPVPIQLTYPGCVQVFAPTLPGSYQLEVTQMSSSGAPTVTPYTVPNSPPQRFSPPLAGGKAIFAAVVDGRTVDSKVIDVPLVSIYQFYSNPGCQLVTLSAPAPGEFLLGKKDSRQAARLDTSLFISSPNSAYETASQNYYKAIDPFIARTTLDGFKNANHFSDNTLTHVDVNFANSGDLGFGREMHCVQGPQSVACYVTNHGSIDSPDSGDIRLPPGATVAMEYSVRQGKFKSLKGFPLPKFVKYFVYAPDGATRLTSADLDGFGARPVPQLCMVCHGGKGGGTVSAPDFTANGGDVGARFLPFDKRFYLNLSASDATKIADLNSKIVANANPNAAESDFIVHQSDPNYVPTAWANDPTHPFREMLYKNVVAPACRTCHIAHDVGGDGIPSFATAAEFEGKITNVEQRVFYAHDMPHAMATYDLFWASNQTGKPTNNDPPPAPSTSMPGLLKLFGKQFTNRADWGDCDQASPDSSGAPVNLSQVQTIFTASCVGCHGSSNPSAGLNLNTNARQNLLNAGLVKPGNACKSVLYERVAGGGMPLGGALTPAQIAMIKKWLDQGAQP